jgi:hypothetical protein
LYNAIKSGLILQDFAGHLVDVVAATHRATQVGHAADARANVQPLAMHRTSRPIVGTGDETLGFWMLLGGVCVHLIKAPFDCKIAGGMVGAIK